MGIYGHGIVPSGDWWRGCDAANGLGSIRLNVSPGRKDGCRRGKFALGHEGIASEMGHIGPVMMYNHYRDIVRKDDAERFWRIMPPDEA